MAIVADLIAANGTVREAGQRANAIELPPNRVQRIAAAGAYDLTTDSEIYLFHNLSTSQVVYIRLNLDSDNTAAADGDDKSIRVDIGETFAFGMPAGVNSASYKLMVA